MHCVGHLFGINCINYVSSWISYLARRRGRVVNVKLDDGNTLGNLARANANVGVTAVQVVVLDGVSEALGRTGVALFNLLLATVQGRLVPDGKAIAAQEDFLVTLAADALAALVLAELLLVAADAVDLDTLEVSSASWGGVSVLGPLYYVFTVTYLIHQWCQCRCSIQ